MEKNIDENLEKIRDEKCFPLARNIFKELPAGLLASDQKPLQLKCLSAMLSTDLNVAQEVSYVSQLILGIISGLNATVQTCGLENDDDRYKRIAQEILKIVSGEVDKITLGKVTPESTAKDFSVIKEKLSQLFVFEALSQIEVKYIMDGIFDAYTILNNAVQSSITNSTERMECKILGLEFMSDLTLKKLNDVLIT